MRVILLCIMLALAMGAGHATASRDPFEIMASLGWGNLTQGILEANPITGCTRFPARNPANVRDLRPGDIKVVAGVGDSITAGFALTNLPVETRDESWSIGGAQNAITIATFLKHYNPGVVGYSVGLNAGLNTAVSGALVSGIKGQLQTLVQRMKGDAKIDFNNDWKLITILIGANNFCKSCNREARNQPPAFLSELRAALEYAQQNIPRALISLNGMLPLSSLKPAGDKDSHCLSIRFLTQNLCPCAFNSEADSRHMDSVVQASNKHQEDLAREWDRKALPNFNVVYQPGLSHTIIPNTQYLSKFDCFHPSLKAHQEIAVGGWNQLITPVGRKPNKIDLPPKLQCPGADTLLYSRQ